MVDLFTENPPKTVNLYYAQAAWMHAIYCPIERHFDLGTDEGTRTPTPFGTGT